MTPPLQCMCCAGKLRLALFPAILSLCQHYGWAAMKEPLEELIEATAALRKGLLQLVGLLYNLATAGGLGHLGKG